jgi:ATP-dependent DNA helicase PIF1
MADRLPLPSARKQTQFAAMSNPAQTTRPNPVQAEPTLSPEQNRLLDWLFANKPNVFLTGRAGTGKTTLMREFMRRAGNKAAVLAPTGVAAMHAGGQTLHSFFRLPPRLIEPRDIKRLRHARAVKALETLVIDEISMVRADMLWAIDASLRLNRDRNEPFGGVQVILVGDLAQLPPIVQNEEAAYLEMSYGGPFFFHPPVFRDAGFSLLELEHVYRQSDPEFIDVLNAVREGDLRQDQADILNKRVTGRSGLEASATHVVLTATNQTAFEINRARLEGLPTKAHMFEGKVEGQFDPRLFPTEDPLVLKVGARVMLTRNDPQGRWVNGSLAEIEGFDENAVRVRIGDDVYAVEKQKWERNAYTFDVATKALSKTTTGAYTQFPLRLAWAMTIHKAQGLTLDRVYMDISRRLFAHGQAYVALSRARTIEGLELSRPLRPSDIISDARIFDVRSFCDPLPVSVAG